MYTPSFDLWTAYCDWSVCHPCRSWCNQKISTELCCSLYPGYCHIHLRETERKSSRDTCFALPSMRVWQTMFFLPSDCTYRRTTRHFFVVYSSMYHHLTLLRFLFSVLRRMSVFMFSRRSGGSRRKSINSNKTMSRQQKLCRTPYWTRQVVHGSHSQCHWRGSIGFCTIIIRLCGYLGWNRS